MYLCKAEKCRLMGLSITETHTHSESQHVPPPGKIQSAAEAKLVMLI